MAISTGLRSDVEATHQCAGIVVAANSGRQGTAPVQSGEDAELDDRIADADVSVAVHVAAHTSRGQERCSRTESTAGGAVSLSSGGAWCGEERRQFTSR